MAIVIFRCDHADALSALNDHHSLLILAFGADLLDWKRIWHF
jgi:hypothetical protein